MRLDSSNLQESQQKLMEILVKNVFRKHGIKPKSNTLTSQQRQEIRNTMQKLQKQTQHFLENAQKNVTENDVNTQTHLADNVSNRAKKKK
ncbi:hypothetical protein [Fredinandcohnia onubensis]|uniref:hypothetical protein n=1 Tax=Fredinandcohnia onubensis TaxID=1571209 RepID=UPI000C0BC229|nr:hypothetical protein [Fredinandcohnia onubensis]